MAYSLENARFQWDEGERRIRQAGGQARNDLERAVDAVLDELRKRLGSTFTIAELAQFYGEGTDWADDVARRGRAGSESSAAVDAAFSRYAREASDFAGGKQRIQDPNRGRLPSQDY